MAAKGRTRHGAWIGKLGRKVAEAVAVIRHGSPMALDATFRELCAAEAAARARHGQTRSIQAAKYARTHALLAARGR